MLLCAVDERWENTLRDGADFLDHIGDLVRIGDDNLIRFFFTEVVEFFQHFVRGAHVERRLLIGIREALTRHQNGAACGVLRVFEVHVSRCDNGLFQLFAELYDGAVVLF